MNNAVINEYLEFFINASQSEKNRHTVEAARTGNVKLLDLLHLAGGRIEYDCLMEFIMNPPNDEILNYIKQNYR